MLGVELVADLWVDDDDSEIAKKLLWSDRNPVKVYPGLFKDRFEFDRPSPEEVDSTRPLVMSDCTQMLDHLRQENNDIPQNTLRAFLEKYTKLWNNILINANSAVLTSRRTGDSEEKFARNICAYEIWKTSDFPRQVQTALDKIQQKYEQGAGLINIHVANKTPVDDMIMALENLIKLEAKACVQEEYNEWKGCQLNVPKTKWDKVGGFIDMKAPSTELPAKFKYLEEYVTKMMEKNRKCIWRFYDEYDANGLVTVDKQKGNKKREDYCREYCEAHSPKTGEMCTCRMRMKQYCTKAVGGTDGYRCIRTNTVEDVTKDSVAYEELMYDWREKLRSWERPHHMDWEVALPESPADVQQALDSIYGTEKQSYPMVKIDLEHQWNTLKDGPWIKDGESVIVYVGTHVCPACRKRKPLLNALRSFGVKIIYFDIKELDPSCPHDSGQWTICRWFLTEQVLLVSSRVTQDQKDTYARKANERDFNDAIESLMFPRYYRLKKTGGKLKQECEDNECKCDGGAKCGKLTLDSEGWMPQLTSFVLDKDIEDVRQMAKDKMTEIQERDEIVAKGTPKWWLPEIPNHNVFDQNLEKTDVARATVCIEVSNIGSSIPHTTFLAQLNHRPCVRVMASDAEVGDRPSLYFRCEPPSKDDRDENSWYRKDVFYLFNESTGTSHAVFMSDSAYHRFEPGDESSTTSSRVSMMRMRTACSIPHEKVSEEDKQHWSYGQICMSDFNKIHEIDDVEEKRKARVCRRDLMMNDAIADMAKLFDEGEEYKKYLNTPQKLRRAMMLYGFIVHDWMNCEKACKLESAHDMPRLIPRIIPKSIAIPWVTLAKDLDMRLSHPASMAMEYNFKFKDNVRPNTMQEYLDNVEPEFGFFGEEEETLFFRAWWGTTFFGSEPVRWLCNFQQAIGALYNKVKSMNLHELDEAAQQKAFEELQESGETRDAISGIWDLFSPQFETKLLPPLQFMGNAMKLVYNMKETNQWLLFGRAWHEPWGHAVLEGFTEAPSKESTGKSKHVGYVFPRESCTSAGADLKYCNFGGVPAQGFQVPSILSLDAGFAIDHTMRVIRLSECYFNNIQVEKGDASCTERLELNKEQSHHERAIQSCAATMSLGQFYRTGNREFPAYPHRYVISALETGPSIPDFLFSTNFIDIQNATSYIENMSLALSAVLQKQNIEVENTDKFAKVSLPIAQRNFLKMVQELNSWRNIHRYAVNTFLIDAEKQLRITSTSTTGGSGNVAVSLLRELQLDTWQTAERLMKGSIAGDTEGMCLVIICGQLYDLFRFAGVTHPIPFDKITSPGSDTPICNHEDMSKITDITSLFFSQHSGLTDQSSVWKEMASAAVMQKSSELDRFNVYSVLNPAPSNDQSRMSKFKLRNLMRKMARRAVRKSSLNGFSRYVEGNGGSQLTCVLCAKFLRRMSLDRPDIPPPIVVAGAPDRYRPNSQRGSFTFMEDLMLAGSGISDSKMVFAVLFVGGGRGSPSSDWTTLRIQNSAEGTAKRPHFRNTEYYTELMQMWSALISDESMNSRRFTFILNTQSLLSDLQLQTKKLGFPCSKETAPCIALYHRVGDRMVPHDRVFNFRTDMWPVAFHHAKGEEASYREKSGLVIRHEVRKLKRILRKSRTELVTGKRIADTDLQQSYCNDVQAVMQTIKTTPRATRLGSDEGTEVVKEECTNECHIAQVKPVGPSSGSVGLSVDSMSTPVMGTVEIEETHDFIAAQPKERKELRYWYNRSLNSLVASRKSGRGDAKKPCLQCMHTYSKASEQLPIRIVSRRINTDTRNYLSMIYLIMNAFVQPPHGNMRVTRQVLMPKFTGKHGGMARFEKIDMMDELNTVKFGDTEMTHMELALEFVNILSLFEQQEMGNFINLPDPINPVSDEEDVCKSRKPDKQKIPSHLSITCLYRKHFEVHQSNILDTKKGGKYENIAKHNSNEYFEYLQSMLDRMRCGVEEWYSEIYNLLGVTRGPNLRTLNAPSAHTDSYDRIRKDMQELYMGDDYVVVLILREANRDGLDQQVDKSTMIYNTRLKEGFNMMADQFNVTKAEKHEGSEKISWSFYMVTTDADAKVKERDTLVHMVFPQCISPPGDEGSGTKIFRETSYICIIKNKNKTKDSTDSIQSQNLRVLKLEPLKKNVFTGFDSEEVAEEMLKDNVDAVWISGFPHMHTDLSAHDPTCDMTHVHATLNNLFFPDRNKIIPLAVAVPHLDFNNHRQQQLEGKNREYDLWLSRLQVRSFKGTACEMATEYSGHSPKPASCGAWRLLHSLAINLPLRKEQTYKAKETVNPNDYCETVRYWGRQIENFSTSQGIHQLNVVWHYYMLFYECELCYAHAKAISYGEYSQRQSTTVRSLPFPKCPSSWASLAHKRLTSNFNVLSAHHTDRYMDKGDDQHIPSMSFGMYLQLFYGGGCPLDDKTCTKRIVQATEKDLLYKQTAKRLSDRIRTIRWKYSMADGQTVDNLSSLLFYSLQNDEAQQEVSLDSAGKSFISLKLGDRKLHVSRREIEKADAAAKALLKQQRSDYNQFLLQTCGVEDDLYLQDMMDDNESVSQVTNQLEDVLHRIVNYMYNSNSRHRQRRQGLTLDFIDDFVRRITSLQSKEPLTLDDTKKATIAQSINVMAEHVLGGLYDDMKFVQDCTKDSDDTSELVSFDILWNGGYDNGCASASTITITSSQRDRLDTAIQACLSKYPVPGYSHMGEAQTHELVNRILYGAKVFFARCREKKELEDTLSQRMSMVTLLELANEHFGNHASHDDVLLETDEEEATLTIVRDDQDDVDKSSGVDTAKSTNQDHHDTDHNVLSADHVVSDEIPEIVVSDAGNTKPSKDSPRKRSQSVGTIPIQKKAGFKRKRNDLKIDIPPDPAKVASSPQNDEAEDIDVTDWSGTDSFCGQNNDVCVPDLDYTNFHYFFTSVGDQDGTGDRKTPWKEPPKTQMKKQESFFHGWAALFMWAYHNSINTGKGIPLYPDDRRCFLVFQRRRWYCRTPEDCACRLHPYDVLYLLRINERDELQQLPSVKGELEAEYRPDISEEDYPATGYHVTDGTSQEGVISKPHNVPSIRVDNMDHVPRPSEGDEGEHSDELSSSYVSDVSSDGSMGQMEGIRHPSHVTEASSSLAPPSITVSYASKGTELAQPVRMDGEESRMVIESHSDKLHPHDDSAHSTTRPLSTSTAKDTEYGESDDSAEVAAAMQDDMLNRGESVESALDDTSSLSSLSYSSDSAPAMALHVHQKYDGYGGDDERDEDEENLFMKDGRRKAPHMVAVGASTKGEIGGGTDEPPPIDDDIPSKPGKGEQALLPSDEPVKVTVAHKTSPSSSAQPDGDDSELEDIHLE